MSLLACNMYMCCFFFGSEFTIGSKMFCFHNSTGFCTILHTRTHTHTSPSLPGRNSYGEEPYQQSTLSFSTMNTNISLPTLTTETSTPQPPPDEPSSSTPKASTDTVASLKRDKEILEAKLRTSVERNHLLENEQMDMSKRVDHEKVCLLQMRIYIIHVWMNVITV